MHSINGWVGINVPILLFKAHIPATNLAALVVSKTRPQESTVLSNEFQSKYNGLTKRHKTLPVRGYTLVHSTHRTSEMRYA